MNCAKSKKSRIDKEATLIHDGDTHYVCNQQTNESNQSILQNIPVNGAAPKITWHQSYAQAAGTVRGLILFSVERNIGSVHHHPAECPGNTPKATNGFPEWIPSGELT